MFTEEEEGILVATVTMLQEIFPMVTHLENEELEKEIEEEVVQAIWGLELDKVPRPNGFTLSLLCMFGYNKKRSLQNVTVDKEKSKVGGSTNSPFFPLSPRNPIPRHSPYSNLYHYATYPTKS